MDPEGDEYPSARTANFVGEDLDPESVELDGASTLTQLYIGEDLDPSDDDYTYADGETSIGEDKDPEGSGR